MQSRSASGGPGRGTGFRGRLGAGSAARPAEPDDHDDETTTCLGCHDGTLAVAAVRTRSFGGYHLSGSHPVDIPYRREGAADPYEALRDPHRLDRRIRLFDDRVECGSCHSPYAGSERLLVVPLERSELCVSCHEY